MGYVMHSISAYGLQACRIKASVVVPITPAASINIAFSVYGGAVHTLVPESGTETGRALEAEGVGVVALRLEGPLQPVSEPLQLRLGHLHRGRLRRAYQDHIQHRGLAGPTPSPIWVRPSSSPSSCNSGLSNRMLVFAGSCTLHDAVTALLGPGNLYICRRLGPHHAQAC